MKHCEIFNQFGSRAFSKSYFENYLPKRKRDFVLTTKP
jgi:hypothetical protein